MTILITGANGKLGRALIAHFAPIHPIHAAARVMPDDLPPGVRGFAIGALDGATDWSAALDGVTAIIHCAALTWVGDGGNQHEYFRVNEEGTANLARQAATAGVARFVFVSSLTVNGKHSGDRAFRHDDVPNPQSPYSRSKRAAEQALEAIAAERAMTFTIVRPPRIFWPELSGNLRQLAALVRRGIPIPFGAIRDNRRDNLSASNLVSLLALCVDHPAAANRTFLASDDDPLSTRELLERIGRAVGRKPRFVALSPALVRALVSIAPQRLRGRLTAQELGNELTGDLRVDMSETRARLRWQPGPSVL